MSTDRLERIKELFAEGQEMPLAQRDEWLVAACGTDDALRAEVSGLLDSLDEAGRYFDALSERVAGSAFRELAWSELAGQRLGAYRVIRLLGSGGMGNVYLAERADGQFEQQVAIKLIRGGFTSESMTRRFVAERQLLARLKHPGIAQLLDGGITPTGAPYLVMEYVPGTPITNYCDRLGLGIPDRLRLFMQLADAVQYLHRNLIVHRDLKPANVLVTAQDQLKLLDFGIAKLLDQDTGDARTGGATRVMTPQYASPEQVRGERITTAADVYSLGVVLYELLAGTRPFASAATAADLERAILESDVAWPSSLAPVRWRRSLKGDLDTICLTALQKESDRRYQSADQMIEDIRRYLARLPITARKDTIGYRTRKFLRRHAVGVAATAAVVVLTTGFAVAARRQAERVSVERDRAAAVADLLVDVFEVADPGQARGESVTAREVLDRGVTRIRADTATSPELRAHLLSTTALVYRNLGLYRQAGAVAGEALTLRREALGDRHPDVARSLNELGEIQRLGGNLAAADTTLRAALTAHRVLGVEGERGSAESMDRLGLVLLMRGRMDSAEALFREALSINERLAGADSLPTGSNVQNLGAVLAARGREAEAEPLFRRALAIRRASLGENHPAVGATLNNYASLLGRLGRYEEAIPVQQQALDLYQRILGPEHPQAATMLNNLGLLHYGRGDPAAAEQPLRRSLEIRRKALGGRHPDVGQSLANLGLVLQDLGQRREAEALHRESLGIRRQALGANHVLVAQSLNNLGLCLTLERRFPEAERLLREALQMLTGLVGDAHPLVASSRQNLGSLSQARGDPVAAESEYRQALGIRRQALPAGHLHTAVSLLGVGEALLEQGKAADALPILEEAAEIRRASLPAGHWQVAEVESALGGTLAALGRFGDAEPLLTASLPRLEGAGPPAASSAARARARLASLYARTGRSAEAQRIRGGPGDGEG